MTDKVHDEDWYNYLTFNSYILLLVLVVALLTSSFKEIHEFSFKMIHYAQTIRQETTAIHPLQWSRSDSYDLCQ